MELDDDIGSWCKFVLDTVIWLGQPPRYTYHMQLVYTNWHHRAISDVRMESLSHTLIQTGFRAINRMHVRTQNKSLYELCGMLLAASGLLVFRLDCKWSVGSPRTHGNRTQNIWCLMCACVRALLHSQHNSWCNTITETLEELLLFIPAANVRVSVSYQIAFLSTLTHDTYIIQVCVMCALITKHNRK